MKRTLIIVLVSLIAFFATEDIYAAEKRVFEEVANLPDVESVYVGPAALRLAGNSAATVSGLPGMPNGLAASLKSIKSLEVLSSRNAASNTKIKAVVRKIIASKHLELIIESKENGEATRIYAYVPKNAEGNAPLANLLIENSDGKEYAVVYINGTIDTAAMQQILKEK